MWLINQDERKKFISATIEEMATPFLDKNKRPDSFYWEALFEFEIPIKILSEISKILGELLKDTSKVNNNVRSLINLIINNQVHTLYLTHKDRLLRFGSELVFSLCHKFGTKIILIDEAKSCSFEQELAQDVIELMTVFPLNFMANDLIKIKKH